MIPVLDAADFLEPARPGAGKALEAALHHCGAAHLRLPGSLRGTLERALDAARAFFELPEAERASAALEGSPHHRGWSVMHNERDWREQVHLGRELPAAGPLSPEWKRLEGPNLWPAGLDPGFRAALEAHLEACADLGRGLVEALGIGPDASDRASAYLLMKLIAYHPQRSGAPPRRGVAAHVDFSLLTLLAQDASGGLEIRDPVGRWVAVSPVADALFVNVGELLEALTGGRLRATPHRVTHRATDRPRLSLPVFFNPPLEAWIRPPGPFSPEVASPGPDHVHRVLTGREGAFRFGEAEWRRKGLNLWCAACCG